jgi:hypothetical protein
MRAVQVAALFLMVHKDNYHFLKKDFYDFYRKINIEKSTSNGTDKR